MPARKNIDGISLQQVAAQDQRYSLPASYIHKYLNILLLSNQRKHQRVIYHFFA
ncbi:hypothetical protein [Chitinophaga nivalis]|uniref:Uncharacterized protein n=1 Tax=Chitinophaga nivalis TaxID=2991709 RepID=A0ABT3IHZ5_9BACT|nr:hypothetical protein [Chitinophaga nivalis]MCW3466726.1 hypothetical protein [Chitinophaga nivalis]MCW3483583.1 hypothetical protein [Chitinophaga nivalis]